MTAKLILPPSCLMISIAIMVALHLLLPVRQIVPSPYRYLGIALLAVGLVLNIWSDQIFKKARTTVNPFERSSRLVTKGPYRLSRHPMYLGMVLILVGLGVVLGSAAPWAVVPAFVLVAVKFMGVEEKAMEETFGQAYRDYRRRVRRWI